MRVWLVCHGLAPGARSGLFGADGEPEPPGQQQRERLVSALAGPLARGAAVCRSPAAASAGTASILGLPASRPEPALREVAYGGWTGRSLADVLAQDPAGAATWMKDPAAAPAGGESLLGLLGRVRGWLDGAAAGGSGLVAVAGPAVLRAVVVEALQAPPPAFWRIDVEPYALLRLTGRAGRWNLRITPAG